MLSQQQDGAIHDSTSLADDHPRVSLSNFPVGTTWSAHGNTPFHLLVILDLAYCPLHGDSKDHSSANLPDMALDCRSGVITWSFGLAHERGSEARHRLGSHLVHAGERLGFLTCFAQQLIICWLMFYPFSACKQELCHRSPAAGPAASIRAIWMPYMWYVPIKDPGVELARRTSRPTINLVSASISNRNHLRKALMVRGESPPK